jgi:hypothetical protein
MSVQTPLTGQELERLWRWERHMTWFYGAAMVGLFLASMAVYRYGDLVWVRRPLLAGVLTLVIAAAVLQFRERCPRCGARLRSRLLAMLPSKCARCSVAFPRPEPGTA